MIVHIGKVNNIISVEILKGSQQCTYDIVNDVESVNFCGDSDFYKECMLVVEKVKKVYQA